MVEPKSRKPLSFEGTKTVLIAEAGINHGGSLKKAMQMIDAAVRGGADLIKFQTYVTEKRCSDSSSTLFGILKACELPFDAFRELKIHCFERGIHFFSTPFDEDSLAYLEDLGCDIYKISSFDVPNKSFLRLIAQTGKTIVMSTGMSTLNEISDAVDILKEGQCKIILLHCVSSYPLNPADADLRSISQLKARFDTPVGFSDHSPGIELAPLAVAGGATVLEKHFRLIGDEDCVDAAVSIDENQLTEMISSIRRIESILGNGALGIRESENSTQIFRRIRG